MTTLYCNLCKRPVEAKRNIGIGTLLLCVLTGGFWLIAIPFYSKRCPICKSESLSNSPPTSQDGISGIAKKKGTNWMLVLGVLAVIGIIGNIAKPTKPQSTPSSVAPAADSIAIVGSCNKYPHEIFPVGEKIESNDLARLTDSNCPNAKFYPDERIEVSYQSKHYIVQTKKLNFTGPAYYEIQSIKAK